MRFLSLALTALTVLSTQQVHAQSCLAYNRLSLPVTYRDVCVSASCMTAETFMPDFDIPDGEGFQARARLVGTYPQDFCAASLTQLPKTCANCDECPFSKITGNARGQVQSQLGSDGLPIWQNANNVNGNNVKKSIASAETFNKWYNDTTATRAVQGQLVLQRVENTQVFQFGDNKFFPINSTQGFMGDVQQDDDQQNHNFGFTTHIVAPFIYNGGEKFTFQGDDDVWVFIDGKLVIDIGGLHETECRTILLDEASTQNGNTGIGKVYTCTNYKQIINPSPNDARLGETYTIDNLIPRSSHTLAIFHAERHKTQSTFAMSTSIGFSVGDVSGLDLNLPSPFGARISIRDGSEDEIKLPYPSDGTLIPITLRFPPSTDTEIRCKILKKLYLDPLLSISQGQDRSQVAPPVSPIEMEKMDFPENEDPFAHLVDPDPDVMNFQGSDTIIRACATNNSADNQIYHVNVKVDTIGSGYLYCVAARVNEGRDDDITPTNPLGPDSDYTSTSTTQIRGMNYYRKWAVTAISASMPTDVPTTPVPVTDAPTSTMAPTQDPNMPTNTPNMTTNAPTNMPTNTPTDMPSTNITTGGSSGSNGNNTNTNTTTMPTTTDMPTEMPTTDMPTDAPTDAPSTNGDATPAGAGTTTTSSKPNIGLIVGVVVGGVVLIVLIILAILYVMKRKKNAVTNTTRTQMEMA